MQPSDRPSALAEPSKASPERCAGRPLRVESQTGSCSGRPFRATLPKEERLSGKKAIARLMKEGKWSRCGDLKYCFLAGGGESCNRVMVAVPKRLFKRAVKRNLLKRRLREAYRTQKQLLGTASRAQECLPDQPDAAACGGMHVDLLLQYNSPEILPYDRIREAVAEILGAVAGKMLRSAIPERDVQNEHN